MAGSFSIHFAIVANGLAFQDQPGEKWSGRRFVGFGRAGHGDSRLHEPLSSFHFCACRFSLLLLLALASSLAGNIYGTRICSTIDVPCGLSLSSQRIDPTAFWPRAQIQSVDIGALYFRPPLPLALGTFLWARKFV